MLHYYLYFHTCVLFLSVRLYSSAELLYTQFLCFCVSDLQVITSTSDKASHNQKLYRLHKVGNEVTTYKAWNSFSSDDRYIFFISDPPHLMKTIQNNVSKSKAGGTRYLWVCLLFYSAAQFIQTANNRTSKHSVLINLITYTFIQIT